MGSRMFLLFLFSLAAGKITEDEGVWLLDEQNFDEALAFQNGLLVEFYAPWCTHCQKLAPEYTRAAKRLRNRQPPIYIAKVDGSTQGNLTEKYEVKSYPTLKYFQDKKPIDYTGLKTEDSIVNWVLKQSGNSLMTVKNLLSLQGELEKSKVNVILFAELNSKEHNIFTIVAKTVDDPSFFICNDKAAWENYKVKAPAVVILKQFDEKRVDFKGLFSSQEIIKFVEKYKRPLVVQYDENTDQVVFGKNKPCLLVLRHDSEAKEYEKMLKKISRQLEGKLLVAYLDISVEANRKLAGNFGLIGKRQPCAMILDPVSDKNYLLEGTIDEDSLKQFMKDWKAKKIEPVYKSENPPSKTHEKHVRIVVGKTFEEIVLDPTKDVLLEFYAPWCEHCKALAPKYEELAKKLRHTKDLIIGKIDATANEIKGYKPKGFPTIKFYTKDNKKGIDFEGEREVKDLLEFIEDNATVKLNFKEDL